MNTVHVYCGIQQKFGCSLIVTHLKESKNPNCCYKKNIQPLENLSFIWGAQPIAVGQHYCVVNLCITLGKVETKSKGLLLLETFRMFNSEGKMDFLLCLEWFFLSQHFITAELNTSMSPVMTAVHWLLFSNESVCVWSFAVLCSFLLCRLLFSVCPECFA